MFQAVRLLNKCALTLPMIALWSCAAISQPISSVDAKATERIIRQNNGVAAIVLNEKGEAVVVNREGQVVPTCQVCTPELERRYGPQCGKAEKASEAFGKPAETSATQSPLICNKLSGTTVRGVKPISVLRHTGSECMTFFFDNGGQAVVYEYCW